MDFSECMTTAEEPKACKDFRDDYLECLHHRKEVSGGGGVVGCRAACLPRAAHPVPDSFLMCMFVQFARLNAFFREDKRQREAPDGGAGHGGGGH